MNRRQFIDRLKAAGMETVALAIEQLPPTCVRFDTIPADETQIPIGASKLGGIPDLPREIDWPLWNGQPLDFILQLNLSDISLREVCEPLPKSGWLSFFYQTESRAWGFDPKDRGSWRVLFFEGLSDDLVRQPLSPDGDRGALLRTCRLVFREEPNPDWPDTAVEDLGLSDEEFEQYDFILNDLDYEKKHQILGDPSGIQKEAWGQQRQCQFVSNGLYMGGSGGPAFDKERARELESGAKDWRLLAQIDSDEEAAIEWGDRGRLYFWIREDDRERRDFSNVWMILECF
jgi:uncharacterized protein YwqG